MVKVWISGSNGQLGKALNDVINPLKYEVLNTGKDDLDVTNIDDVLAFGDVNRPDIIINCSGFTGVKACESYPHMAYKVNAMGARNLAIAAAKVSAKIVQISTDDVFDGKSKTPYKEFDSTAPISIYGNSKLAGEKFIKEFTHKHFIIRSNWVYGEGDNFVNEIITKARDTKKLAVAGDQFGSPTSAYELASFILYIMDTNEYGTYHATCKGICSRYDFAKEILKLVGLEVKLQAVTGLESDILSERPAYAALDNFVLEIMGTYQFPDWKEALKTYINRNGE